MRDRRSNEVKSSGRSARISRMLPGEVFARSAISPNTGRGAGAIARRFARHIGSSGLLLLLLHLPALPQGSVSRGPLLDPRNPELERAAQHNLDVARFYIKRKKWKAAEGRLQDIVRDHPAFSRIAEVYYLLGEVYRQTGRRELALELYQRVIEEFPDHELADRARQRLRDLGASPPKGE